MTIFLENVFFAKLLQTSVALQNPNSVMVKNRFLNPDNDHEVYTGVLLGSKD